LNVIENNEYNLFFKNAPDLAYIAADHFITDVSQLRIINLELYYLSYQSSKNLPISCAIKATGRLMSQRSLLASTRMSIRSVHIANSGARGKEAANS